MEAKEADKISGFRRKVYTKMYNSSISRLQADREKPQKKIIPTSKKLGLREEFKKVFLPLLIDVFELRQLIQNYKSSQNSSILLPLGKQDLSLEKTLSKLKLLQEEIAESKRWVEGIISQIDKGIAEAKEALEHIETTDTKTPKAEVKKTNLSNKIKFELNELLDEGSSPGKLFSRLFKRKKS